MSNCVSEELFYRNYKYNDLFQFHHQTFKQIIAFCDLEFSRWLSLGNWLQNTCIS